MANEEKPVISYLGMDALAEGVAQATSNAYDQQQSLVKGFNSYQWSDRDRALESLEFWGKTARQLYHDQSTNPNIGEQAPISFNDVIAGYTKTINNEDGTVSEEVDISDPIDLYNKWEEENLKYIKTAKDPEIVVDRLGYEESVKKYASQKRQETHAQGREQFREKYGYAGRFATNLTDMVTGGALDVAQAVAPVTNFAMSAISKDFDIKQYATEVLDPEYQQTFTRAAIGAGAQAGALIAAPVVTLGGLVVGGVGEVANRYSETQRLTGDQGAANKAATIEAGSQVVGLAGDVLGVGRFTKTVGKVLGNPLEKILSKNINKAITNPAVGAAAESMLVEGAAEGAQTAGSNVAENIQKGRPTFEDVGRGVPTAIAAGGIAGGVVVGVQQAQKNQFINAANERAGTSNVPTNLPTDFVTPDDILQPEGAPIEFPVEARIEGTDQSDVRAQEAQELGKPVTPRTIQKIGAVTVTDDLQFNTAESEESNMPRMAVTEDGNIVIEPASQVQDETLYEFEDGSIDVRNEDGNIVRKTPDGNREEAFDTNVYFDEATLAKVMNAQVDGTAQLTLDANSEPVLKSTDGNNTVEKLNYSKTPAVGLYRSGISAEKSPNRQQIVRGTKIVPAKIRTINVDTSMGAMGPRVQVKQDLSQMSQRANITEGLTQGARTALGSIYVTPIKSKDVDSEVNALSGGTIGGMIELLDRVNNQVDPTALKYKSRVEVGLINSFLAEIKQAAASGDLLKQDALEKTLTELAPKLTGTDVGQALAFRQGQDLTKLKRAESTAKAVKQARDTATVQEAEMENLSPAEIVNPAVIDEDIKATQAQIEQEATKQTAPADAEVELLSANINDIETRAETLVAERNNAIDADIEKTDTSIKKVEKTLERTKLKDIVAAEKEIAVDSAQLALDIGNAQELADVTKEELAKIDADVERAVAQAEKTANAEVKSAVDQTRKAAKEQKDRDVRMATAKVDLLKNAVVREKENAKVFISALEKRLVGATPEETARIQSRIDKRNEPIAKKQAAVDAAQAKLTEIQNTEYLDEKTQEILSDLSSGITVKQTPVGKNRNISVLTKKGGLDLGKLFAKSKGEALPALSALSNTVNKLAGTIRQARGAKFQSNAAIEALQAKINKNKLRVEKARSAPAIQGKNKTALDAAKKRLEALTKAPRTKVDDVLTKTEKKKLEVYKSKLAESLDKKTNPVKTKKVNELEEQLQELLSKKTRAKLANERVAQKVRAEADKVNAIEEEIAKLQDLANLAPENSTQRHMLNAKIAVLRGAVTKKPDIFQLGERSFISNILSGGRNIIVGVRATAYAYTQKVAVLGIVDAYTFLRNYGAGAEYKSSVGAFISTIVKGSGWARGRALSRAKIATGKSPKTAFKDTEVLYSKFVEQLSEEGKAARRGADEDSDNPLLNTAAAREQDWTNISKEIEYNFSNPDSPWWKKVALLPADAVRGLFKLGGQTGGRLTRFLPGVEFLHSIPFSDAFTAAAAAHYYNADARGIKNNKGLMITDEAGNERPMTVEDLKNFKYNSKENRTKADAAAREYAKKSADAGLPLDKTDELILAEEIFQEMVKVNSPSAYKDAFKLVGQINLNTPTQGYTGMVSQFVSMVAKHIPLGTYVVPVVNSISSFMALSIENSPLQFGIAIGVLPGTRSLPKTERNRFRSQFEFEMGIASAALSTVMMAGIANYLVKQLLLPEDKRDFDIIGRQYSENETKNAAFKAAGGIPYSIKAGNKYIPFAEMPCGLQLGMLAIFAMKVRDGKEADISMLSALGYASLGGVSTMTQLSMAKGLNDIAEAIGTAGSTGNWANASVQLTRGLLLNPVKGALNPASGAQRTLTRFFNNPVDGFKDIKSAIVEGIPGLQGMYGRKTLNLFNEPFKTDAEVFPHSMQRLFSTANGDLDARWLINNNYSMPLAQNIVLSKTDAKQAGREIGPKGEPLDKIDNEARYEIARATQPFIRPIVAKYRERYGTSARSDNVEKRMKNEISRVYSTAIVNYYKRKKLN